MKIRLVSFNIHKGFGPLRVTYTFKAIKDVLDKLNPDIVFLQELHGLHPSKYSNKVSPLELLADLNWPYHAHGVNSVYTSNFHGNAIMSKFEICYWKNDDISTNRIEKRGLLHAMVCVDGKFIDLFCTHLNLSPMGQYSQIIKIKSILRKREKPNPHPLILAGDFNDWSRLGHVNLTKSFKSIKLHNTFPSFMPMVSLDRIYFKGLKYLASSTSKDFKNYSDHNPIIADFEIIT